MKTCTSARTGRTALLAAGVVIATVGAMAATAEAAAPGTPAASAAAAAAAASPDYSGDAYGTTARVGSVVKSGHSAAVVLGCGTNAGISRHKSSAGLDLAPLARTGSVATTATTTASPLRSRTTARTEKLNLLGGMIQATAVEAASATTRAGGSFSTSDNGTQLLGLRIAGRDQKANPDPNTGVDLPGVGYVVLNEHNVTNTAKGASLEVNALHLVVTKQNLPIGARVGADIVVSHARSGLSAPVVGVLGGSAYGTKLTVGKVVTSGASFQKFMPCLGTDGIRRTNTGAGVTLHNGLTTGTIRDSAQGTVGDTSAKGELTSTVEASNLLNGLVKATVIQADAHATKQGGTRTFGDAGSMFGTLSVQGFPRIDAHVAANTVVHIPNVGTLYLHRVIRSGNEVEVRMIELVLTKAQGDLPVGADLQVGVASASVS